MYFQVLQSTSPVMQIQEWSPINKPTVLIDDKHIDWLKEI